MNTATNRMLINLVGALAILVVIVLGFLMFAVPQISAAVTTHRETEAVEVQNEALAAQLTELQAAETRIDELEAETEDLRTEIPAQPNLDDMFVTVAQAATEAGVEIVSATAGDASEWSPPTSDDALSLMSGGGVGGAGPAALDSADEAALIDGADVSDGGADGADGVDGAGSQTAAELGNRLRIPVTVEVVSPNAATATRFIDALANTPRVFSIHDAQVASQTAAHDVYRTTVHFDAFVLTGVQ